MFLANDDDDAAAEIGALAEILRAGLPQSPDNRDQLGACAAPCSVTDRALSATWPLFGSPGATQHS